MKPLLMTAAVAAGHLLSSPAFAASSGVNVSVRLPDRSILYCYNGVRRTGRPASELSSCQGFVNQVSPGGSRATVVSGQSPPIEATGARRTINGVEIIEYVTP